MCYGETTIVDVYKSSKPYDCVYIVCLIF